MFPFWPRTIEHRASLRTAIAVLASVLIAFKFHLQTPYWSGMSVVIIANLYTGSILDKAMMRITGTVIGALFGFYLVGIVANSFLLYLICCFLIIAVCVYYYHYSNYGYAYLLGGLCAFIIISQIIINPANAFNVAIWRPVEIGIGVLISAISVYAIFPNHLKDNISEQVNDLFQDYIKEMQQLSFCFTQNHLKLTDIAASNLKIKKKIRKATELIGSMNRELGVTQAKTDELRAFLDTFSALARQIHYLIAIPCEPNDLAIMHALSVDKVFEAIAADLLQLQAAFIKDSSPLLHLNTEKALYELERTIKKQPFISNFFYSFLIFINQVNQNISLFHALLSKNVTQKKDMPFVLDRKARIRSDNELIKHSIKAGLAVLLALSFWMVSNWPGGINGIISSLVISIRRNLFDMKNIIIHRLIGCTLGGSLALASIAIVEMNLYDFILIMFFSVWAFTWFMFKFPKYSYIGLQANIALIIALAQEGGPPVVLDPPLQRLAGIVIGIVASFIVANVLWRADVWSILNRYLDKIYKFIIFNLHQVLCATRKKNMHDLANLFWLARGLIESLGDTPLNNKKQNRLSALREQFESLVMIQATLSYILVSIDREKAAVTAALFPVDLSVYEEQLLILYGQKNQTGAYQLYQDLKVEIEKIEKNPIYSNVGFYELRNLLAYLNALVQLSLSLS
jgi:uncharacterized membrane protein YccC